MIKFVTFRDLSQEEFEVHINAYAVTAIARSEDDKSSCVVHVQGGETFWVEGSVGEVWFRLDDALNSSPSLKAVKG